MATADKVSDPSVKVWHGHCCCLFVEGVAVDTNGREAALKPEAGVNKLPAAECAAIGADAAECRLSKHEIHATLSVKLHPVQKRPSPLVALPRPCRQSLPGL